MTLPRPPAGWKRPAMPKRVKAAVFVRQGGLCADTGVKLGVGDDKFEYDHRPALWEREFDPDARRGLGDTIPPANDPDHIQAVVCRSHKARSAKDTARRSKENRITGATRGRDKSDRFAPPARGVDVLRPEKPKEKTGRRYDWPKRALQSRNNLARRTRPEPTKEI
ncbi:hypothetical protein [Parvibaculum sp.]|uniref:hypothetical protein n=1 Tax=Parvibaculum sp. TaxID=2024848 RepID=UPI001D92712E|nr:hypothetical protein [Parvibaculum sp.]MBX3490854.1 hypothetical protein [Parvibaculum sp.]